MDATKEELFRALARKTVATKSQADYKKWSEMYDSLTPEELNHVAGGGHAGGKSIDNMICGFPVPGGDY